MHHEVTTAIVFVLSRYLLRDAARCIDYCRAQGYAMVGVIQDDWGEAMRMLHAGKAQVLVAAELQHVDPGRTPRVEFVALQTPSTGPAAPRTGRNERTAVIRRSAAE